MRIYEFVCKNCGFVFNEAVPAPESAAFCPRCGKGAERSWSGKVYTATGKACGSCSGNCGSCAKKCGN